MSELSDLLQKFNVTKLNTFQEKALIAFLKSKKNLILSAPTGTGKTLLMEMMLYLNNGKGVYVSPLKALCDQVANELGRVTSVQELTGDVYLDDSSDVSANVVVSTYEKMDSILRRPYSWLDDISLLILDEVHNMRYQKRSEAIELVLAWALEHGVRIVVGSATIAGLSRVENWLNAEIISHDTRSIPLYEFVKYGTVLISSDGKRYQLDRSVIDFIIGKGKNLLIFESTRKLVESVYYTLKGRYGNQVEMFHGGMDWDTRKKILSKIESGNAKIVVSTTALGQGVNLPFYAVWFRSMKLPEIENGRYKGFRYLDVTEYKQIAGRAGRPRFDKEGMAIIEAKNEWEARYFLDTYLNGSIEQIDGYLSLFKYILVQLSRRGVADFNQLYSGLRYTFSLKDVTQKQMLDMLEIMRSLGLIYSDGVNYSIEKFGTAVAFTYLDLEDVRYYKDKFEKKEFDILEVIANSPKVREQSKNNDVLPILEYWIKGDDINALTRFSSNLMEKDIQNIIDIATWQAYSIYSLMKALDDNRQYIALKMWLRLEHGVPENALNLVQVSGIGRKIAVFLANKGYTKKSEVCSDLSKVKELMQNDEVMQKQYWRVQQICEKTTRKAKRQLNAKIENFDK
ncbi:hypothetical protein SSRV2_ORF7 [Saccharolobus shibatae rod virus 2]|nr:hypothetical protein [Saccharolobus shibatae filamentous virus 3]WHA35182.1 hypothetical protein SSRV2_ORF7 [Saccharolobus shibatae rod virus 2]